MSNNSAVERRTQTPAFCTNYKNIEYMLCVASAWVGITLMLTPTLLKQKPPFYRALQGTHYDWKLGALFLLIVLLHLVALRFAPCRPDVEPCSRCARVRHACALVRSCSLMFEVLVWFFMTACYGILALSGEITIASGLCPIFAVCASIASFCLSRERSRHQVYLEQSVVDQDRSKSALGLSEV